MFAVTMNRAVVVIIVLCTSLGAEASGQRFIQGAQPEANRLYREARRADAGPWPSGFEEERFIFLGAVTSTTGTKLELAFLDTIWGHSRRSTKRLLVFSAAGKYVGRYSVDVITNAPSIVPPARLHFPVSPKYGNEVDFASGPPSTIWLDGDNFQFEPASLLLQQPAAGGR